VRSVILRRARPFMNTYKVTYEYKGKISTEIKADNGEHAIERAVHEAKAVIKDSLPQLKLHSIKIKKVE